MSLSFDLLVNLVVVLALAFVALKLLHRLSGGAGSGDPGFRVVRRLPLGPHHAVCVLRVGKRLLLVGVTQHAVQLLTELDPDEALEPTLPTPPTVTTIGWDPLLVRIGERVRQWLGRG